MFVTRRLLACGYAVVPARDSGMAVLARAVSSFPDLPVAHVGGGHDVRALAQAASRLQRRVSALVAIGGPLGLLLDESDGLEVPTLVVTDGANRALRRRARRGLPPGSRVVRASDFDAALQAAVEFLDVRTSDGAGRPAARPARRLSSRLAPAALLAAPAALFVTASAANAAATCTDAIDGDTLFVTCEGDGDVALEIGVSADGQILVDRQAKVSVSEIKVIKVISTSSNTLMLVNEQDHKLGTGLGTPEDPFVPVQLDVKLDGGQDTLAWVATEGIDQFKLLGEGYDVTGDAVVDHKVLGAETLKLDLFGGNDLLDGGDWLSKILVDGGTGDDVLIGGLADDSFKLSLGKDVLDGAGGFDEIKLVTDDSQVKLTDALVSLADAGSESSYKQFEALSYLGGKLDSKVEVAGIKLQKVDLDGGGGLDELKLTTDDSLVTISDSLIKLSDAGSEMSFKQFTLLSYLGGKLDSKVELAGIKLQKIDLDLGDGADLLSLTTEDSSVKLTDSLIELGDALSSIKYAGAESLSYLGGKLDSKVELADLTLQKVDLDGGGGLDEFKLSTDALDVKIADSLVSLVDLGSEVSFKQFEALSYLGGDSANKVEVAAFQMQKVDLDGGAGANEFKLTSDASLVTIGDSAVKLGDTAYSFKQFDLVGFAGGDGPNTFDLSGLVSQKVLLDGGGGSDLLKLRSDDSLVTLSDSLIKLSDGGGEVDFKQFELVSYLGGDSANKVDVSGIKLQKVELDAAGGDDLLSVTSDASLFKISDTGLVLGVNTIGHKAFESLAVFGGESANKIDGSQVTGLKLTLDGGGGNDVLLGGALSDVLFGKLGDDVLGGGLGDDKLGGGLGNDQLSGDGGLDTVFDEADVNFTATSTSLAGLGTDVLKSIESLHLVGGVHDNVFDASRFKLGGVTLDGGAGDDVLLGSPFADKLLGSIGDDRLTGNHGNDSLYADVGDDYLDGSAGTDLGDGGPGFDIGKSIEIRFNLEK